ncbi:hypothetical protein [Nonomuraea sediminis]|uniref:hypothetical protein n=1 Tax=Nonomuraea sediminis TaxID=2835864 RepID=UPI001BDD84DA|nr:hypothetical protein [Nonomuraea sediminis]
MRRALLLVVAALVAGLAWTGPAEAAGPVKVVVAGVKAGPGTQSGACPTTVGFSAVLVVKGHGVTRYRWVRSDGSKGAIKKIKVSGARKVVVRDRQTFESSVSGWQAVQVLGRAGLSAKARFSVQCEGAPIVYDAYHPLPQGLPGRPLEAAASVSADPAGYSGSCPATVGFTGLLQVSRVPARVVYQWIDSAAGESAPQVAEFGAQDARSRTVTSSVSASTSGWRAIRILEPGGHDSGRAPYTVTCTEESPVEATVAVDRPNYEGPCPVNVTFTGEIKVNRAPLDVEYRWAYDNGARSDVVKLDFPTGTTKPATIALPQQFNASGKGWRAVELLSPVKKLVKVDYTVTCNDGTPR